MVTLSKHQNHPIILLRSKIESSQKAASHLNCRVDDIQLTKTSRDLELSIYKWAKPAAARIFITMARCTRDAPQLVNCKWWKRGYCQRGDLCYFRHDPCLLGVDQKADVSTNPSDANATTQITSKCRIHDTIIDSALY
ncbi:hypothetical protein H113_01043 [Trichophyton rubrum MR1459]|uniref:C3H1-type domain-containing protein n=1 Tax=Trichophyton rubrum (strain ATCC MYA-4607 / CBS 118892) TaxID=559305 RepID=F2SY09_TRIRC|nr:uncharacterized protein TERG_07468 [Trichophyton rubrum CBS 118892]XP_047607243.1 uncharacterized protein TERG_07468 [Trichophyton rubrum CBS 118892]EZF99280.1 hypothetical protein H113_01043 [Trichophyton rubrum MR1459]EZG10347.1 hypothetical protein H106_00839 [Trichophyton rubrum CBS 735.88]EGD91246.2 hypothetical protein TERG_07468 [Trichophyton rubrum CBS 118892]KFL62703.1 hypothetical protein TERG_07468 [Trichophyton rubrum CBS 118892]